MEKAKIWVIGMAVMGSNLARNIADKWYRTSVYNREPSMTETFLQKYGTENLVGTYSLEAFVDSIAKPRKIIMMIMAGKPVDEVIGKLKPLLSEGDTIIDCGNSFYKDTQRRFKELSECNLHFIGCGVSGGEEWALKWPSIMPGGDKESYEDMREIFESITAADFGGGKCVTYVGENGAGHFVKMVHNGIEYAVMQMIAEAYDGLRKMYGMNPEEISRVFERFDSWKLNSYLFEITGKVLKKKDEWSEDTYLVDKILDRAGAKWTGKWTSIEGLDRAESISTIAEATFSRAISAEKELRVKLSGLYTFPDSKNKPSQEEYIKLLENTLYLGLIFAYSQGYALIMKTSKEENWNVNLSEISRIWQGGCIIRAEILDFLTKTFLKNTGFEHMFELQEIRNEILGSIQDYEKIICIALENHIPVPVLSSGINYFHSMTQAQSNANLIQWLRDYFGAHTYERIDREWTFHTEW